MALFNKSQMDAINSIAKSSKTIEAPKTTKSVASINSELDESSKAVEEYFKDSKALLITTRDELHAYIDDVIECGIAGIDTETTGLDRIKDTIVGTSLYHPNGVEVYIPSKHRIPVFETFYKNQLSYEDVGEELQRLVDANTKLIFANADFDLYMIWKDLNVDLCPSFYYDVILSWRCIQEDELDNRLKPLYNKYVLGGSGDPKQFSDFFSPALFPYCKPEIAKLYAANDAKITYDLYKWQLPYITQDTIECNEHKYQNIADLIWHVEFPIVSICQEIERNGMYIDQDTASRLKSKYHAIHDAELSELRSMVQEAINNSDNVTMSKSPFRNGNEFNPRSPVHVKFLVYKLLNLPKIDGKESTGVEILSEFNHVITDKIIAVRSLATNISTFVDKLPEATASDNKIHASFKQIGADTGRMSSANPNLQNIPSKLNDIRHMFRATPSFNKVGKLNQSNTYDNRIYIELSRYDSVINDKDEYILVKDLHMDDIIRLKHNGEDIYIKIFNIVQGTDKTHIIFEV